MGIGQAADLAQIGELPVRIAEIVGDCIAVAALVCDGQLQIAVMDVQIYNIIVFRIRILQPEAVVCGLAPVKTPLASGWSGVTL